MKVTITEDGFSVEGMPPVELAGISPEDCATIAFIHAATWAMQRITDECGMCLASGDARQAIKTAQGRGA